MDWKYFIPHIWDREREVWEDVYLLPVDSDYDGEALCLTVDAFGNTDIAEHGSDRAIFQVEALQKLGDKPFYMDDSSLLIRDEDFTKQELLAWVRVWLQELGFTVTSLIEGSRDEFRDRAFHVDCMDHLERDDPDSTV